MDERPARTVVLKKIVPREKVGSTLGSRVEV
jgi:hypothetical protein